MERATRVAEIESASGVDVPFRTSKPPPPEPDEGRTLMAAASGDLPVSTATRGNRHGVTAALAIALMLLVVLVARTFTSPSATTTSGPVLGAPIDSGGRVRVVPLPIEPAPVAVSTPTLAASPEPSAAPSAPPAAITPPARAAAPPSRHGGNGTAKCDPPYRVDASGHKIFKLECL